MTVVTRRAEFLSPRLNRVALARNKQQTGQHLNTSLCVKNGALSQGATVDATFRGLRANRAQRPLVPRRQLTLPWYPDAVHLLTPNLGVISIPKLACVTLSNWRAVGMTYGLGPVDGCGDKWSAGPLRFEYFCRLKDTGGVSECGTSRIRKRVR